jgi:hypothetical protein
MPNTTVGKQAKEEDVTFGVWPSARKGVGSKPFRTDWRRPRSLNNSVILPEAVFGRFDRSVSHKRVGHRSLTDRLRRARVLKKLNEHGPELNVFWTRMSGLGA